MNRGEFIFCDENPDFLDQVMEFAGTKFTPHDDAPDVASEFWLRIDEIKNPVKLQFIDKNLLL